MLCVCPAVPREEMTCPTRCSEPRRSTGYLDLKEAQRPTMLSLTSTILHPTWAALWFWKAPRTTSICRWWTISRWKPWGALWNFYTLQLKHTCVLQVLRKFSLQHKAAQSTCAHICNFIRNLVRTKSEIYHRTLVKNIHNCIYICSNTYADMCCNNIFSAQHNMKYVKTLEF